MSKYEYIYKCIEENIDEEWNKWLEFSEIFEKSGKQGTVGLFSLKKNGDNILFKLSQYINYLVQHEYSIMKSLNDIYSFCPHYCRTYGMIECKINPNFKKLKNPFVLDKSYSINKEILLCEYIDNSSKFYNYIRSKKIEEDILYSIIKQVMLAINIAQKYKKFTHYDLHSNNVMIKKCDPDLVCLYVFDEDNQFCVPTYGYFPIIIDFGFSYIEDMDDNPAWASLSHTNVGFMSDRFDWVADPKLFLVSVSKEILHKRNSKKSKKFRRIVKNIFHPLKIDWSCGWDDNKDKGASDYVIRFLETFNKKSKLFKEFDHYCIDILQSMIILPLEKQEYNNIEKYYKTFLNEWIKIEEHFKTPFYSIYILKKVVDIAREVRPDYINKNTKNVAIQTFKNNIYENIQQISKFCNLKSVNFEILLCSLIVLSKSIEGMLYDMINKRINKKNIEYEKLPLKNIHQIYAAIDINIPTKYNFNTKTKVLILDCINKSTKIFIPKEDQLDSINDSHDIVKGSYIYDIYKKS